MSDNVMAERRRCTKGIYASQRKRDRLINARNVTLRDSLGITIDQNIVRSPNCNNNDVINGRCKKCINFGFNLNRRNTWSRLEGVDTTRSTVLPSQLNSEEPVMANNVIFLSMMRDSIRKRLSVIDRSNIPDDGYLKHFAELLCSRNVCHVDIGRYQGRPSRFSICQHCDSNRRRDCKNHSVVANRCDASPFCRKCSVTEAYKRQKQRGCAQGLYNGKTFCTIRFTHVTRRQTQFTVLLYF